MAKDKYEISLWADIYVDADASTGAPAHYEEQKLCVIGSNTMTSQCRAIEPKFVRNVNGKNTFTFKMFYIYHDEFTGETYDNPFLKLLVNERKVKVYWQEQWFDLIIKNIQEASNGKSMTFTCEDANINELAKSGFELVFDDELNTSEFTNQGTAQELIETTIDGTDWRLGESEIVPQYSEEATFEVTLPLDIQVVNQTTGVSTSLASGTNILLFYNQVADIYNASEDEYTAITLPNFQFAYADTYKTELNSQLVINADCYLYESSVLLEKDHESECGLWFNNSQFIVFENVSRNYRAKRLVESTRTIIDNYTGRTCEVYNAISSYAPASDSIFPAETGDVIYKYVGSTFGEANYTINMAANPSNFLSTSGWDCNDDDGGIGYYYGYALSTDGTGAVNSGAADGPYLELNNVTASQSDDTDSIYFYNDAMKASSQYFSDGVKIGDKFILRYKTHASVSSAPSSAYEQNCSFTPFVGRYEINDDGHKQPMEEEDNPYFMTASNSSYDSSTGWQEWTLTCKRGFTGADIYSKNLALFLRANRAEKTTYLEAIEFFKYVTDEDGNRINPGDFDKNGIVKVEYFYYNFTKFDEDYRSGEATLDDINNYYLYHGVDEWDEESTYLEPEIVDGFAKIRSINIKQSNRFNILQTIAETFQCWIKFDVQHDSTGKILYAEDSDGTWRLQKYIHVVNEVGEDRGLGFVYGIDLSSIQRTIESSSIVTKTIVLPNDNEFAKNGQCRISRSTSNPPRTDYIYDFGYYTSHGLLDKDGLYNDLYVNTVATDSAAALVAEGYYYWLNKWNTEYEEISAELVEKQTILTEDEALLTTYKGLKDAASNTIKDAKEEIIKILGFEVGVTSWEDATLQSKIYDAVEVYKTSSIITRMAVITSQENLINSYADIIRKLEEKVAAYQAAVAELQSELDEIAEWIRLKSLCFYKKYAAFISEGSWTDESYMDDTLYYLDAQSVAYTSSRPKVSYSISVLRLTSLDGFEYKDFALGEIAYVQDTEFFGYIDAARTTPYKEKVLISEITYNFDEPSKDSFKVQNYKTQFDDLFQRIAAATQTLQYNEGLYARAGEAIAADGTLNTKFLEDTFDANSSVLNRTSLNQSVTTDEQGITVRSQVDAANIVRITSGGIFITDDGGSTWKNAIRGEGVSTRYLTAGQIDTSIIQVMDGNHATFRWDAAGINAYDWNSSTGINYNTFVRFDRFGLYGAASASSLWAPTSEADIWRKAAYGATWSGFFINGAEDSNGNRTQVFKADTNGNLELTGTVYANAGSFSGDIYATNLTLADSASISGAIYASSGKIGGWTISTNMLYKYSDNYAVRLYVPNTLSSNTTVLSAGSATTSSTAAHGWAFTDEKFKLLADGTIRCTGGEIGGWTINSTTIYKDTTIDGETYRAYMYAPTAPASSNAAFGIRKGSSSYPFHVDYDGSLHASNATIVGKITANQGYIGGTTGWVITTGKIYKGTAGSTSGIFLDTTAGTSATIAGTSRSSLMVGVGSYFGVDKYGYLYASGATISGTITASSGQIGSFTISTGIYSNKSSLTANSSGVYIGTDGIALGTGSTFKVTNAGAVTASNITITGGSILINAGTSGLAKIDSSGFRMYYNDSNYLQLYYPRAGTSTDAQVNMVYFGSVYYGSRWCTIGVLGTDLPQSGYKPLYLISS